MSNKEEQELEELRQALENYSKHLQEMRQDLASFKTRVLTKLKAIENAFVEGC